MHFHPTPRSADLQERVGSFMRDSVIPAEAVYEQQLRASGDPHGQPAVMEELKAEARRQGLWNLFMPDERWGPGLTNLEYAPIAELMGRSLIGPEAFNCNAPDTGNMEVLARFASEEQQQRWLAPLLAGEIRSCFSMTEPAVASSDATNIAASIVRDGDEYVIDGRKWWTTNGPRKRTAISLFMGVTDPDAPPHRRQSIVLVPMDTPGVEIVRTLSVFGYDQGEGHAEMVFDGVRVPAANLLQDEGDGFRIAQARLGPGRIHHCMRLLGQAERAVELMCERAGQRRAFGQRLVDHATVQDIIAECRIEIDQARLLTLHAAWLMDEHGAKAARKQISMIKVAGPRVAQRVLDRAIQVFGAAGLSQDTPLAHHYAHARTLRIVDGPDAVHLRTVARREIAEQLGETDRV
jgi:acyl-CoA dehydrogenase